MEQAPNLQNNDPHDKIETLENELSLIDLEIVESGGEIIPERLQEITMRKDEIARELAQLKGEKITPPDTDWNPDTRRNGS